MNRKAGLVAAVALACGLARAADVPPISIVATRTGHKPLLQPGGAAWMATGAFNPAAASVNGRTILLFRARDAHDKSSIGYAESTDGAHFTIAPQPALEAAAPEEQGGGVEDPRVLPIGDTWYLTYTAYNLHDAQLALATSSDLKHWQRRGVILPAYKGAWNEKWTKSGAIVPEQINGRWWMYYLGTKRDADGQERDYMGLASSTDLLHWSDATKQPVLERRPGAFDSRVMEPGPPPLVTSAGILLLYNGADDHLVYGPGWVLFDAKDPSKVLARSEHAFILPALQWERVGTVPNVIFLEGATMGRSDAHHIEVTGYYGGADKYVGAMRIAIEVR